MQLNWNNTLPSLLTLKYLNKILKSRAFMLTALFVVASAVSNFANAIDIIANKSLDTNSLTTRELRAVFSLRLKRWPNGLPITVVVLNNETDLHKTFCKQLLRIFPHQLKLGWDRVTFSGLGQAPIIVKNKEEMIEIIKATPGAIGYIDEAGIMDGESIKKVQLDEN